MTMIHFNYTDSYANPSRGSLAFMPHRRHAANETEILPKPFTVPLLNGQVTVDLQPNASTWVWIVTEYFEEHAESFYTTVPDQDGVLEHTELTKINPSSIPAPYNAVEPAWWAEIKATKDTVTETLLKSGEALEEAQEAIEVGKESIDSTRESASLAKAYSEQSRQSSYDSREYRDEAEQWRDEAKEQADRASTGPESAAQRAEDSATDAENSANLARGYEDQSRVNAAESLASSQQSQSASSNATTKATEAKNSADRSETEANRSHNEADRAKDYADELLDAPREYVEQAEAARDDAQEYRDQAQNHATNAQESDESAESHLTDVIEYASLAEAASSTAQDIASSLGDQWEELQLLNGWENYLGTASYVETPWAYILSGVIRNGDTTKPLFSSPFRPSAPSHKFKVVVSNSGRVETLTLLRNEEVFTINVETDPIFVSLDGLVIPKV